MCPPSSRRPATVHRTVAFDGFDPDLQYAKNRNPKWGCGSLVPVTGIEPVRFLGRGILSYFSYLEPSGTYRILEEHINP